MISVWWCFIHPSDYYHLRFFWTSKVSVPSFRPTFKGSLDTKWARRFTSFVILFCDSTSTTLSWNIVVCHPLKYITSPPTASRNIILGQDDVYLWFPSHGLLPDNHGDNHDCQSRSLLLHHHHHDFSVEWSSRRSPAQAPLSQLKEHIDVGRMTARKLVFRGFPTCEMFVRLLYVFPIHDPVQSSHFVCLHHHLQPQRHGEVRVVPLAWFHLLQ